MAFATKYTLTWLDVNEGPWVVLFEGDGFGGGATALTPGGTPLVIEWNQTEKYDTIIGSHATFQVKYTSEVDDILSQESQVIRVRAFLGGSVRWAGFVSPGQYFRPFNNPVAFVNIVATDGLGELKDLRFEDSNSDPYWGKQTELEAISNILQKTGLELLLREAINIFDTNHSTAATDSALAQTYFDADAYWDEQTDERSNCYDVLSDILTKYGATIRQSSNFWYILRPNTFSKDTITYRTFTHLGVFSSNGSFTSFNVFGDDNFYIRYDQEITRRIGVGQCEVNQQPPRRSNMFKNGSFDAFTWDGGVPDYWAETGSPTYSEDNDTLKMGSANSGSSPTKYIETTVFVDYANSISITFDWTPTYDGAPSFKTLKLQILSSQDGHYLTNSGWSVGVGSYSIAAGVSGTADRVTIDFPEPLSGSGFSRGLSLRVRIYEFFNENVEFSNYFHMDNLRLEVAMDLPDNKLHVYNNPTVINNIAQLDIKVGDSWRTDFFPSGFIDDAYFINYYNLNANLTTSWSIVGDPTSGAQIGEVLARQTVEGFRNSLDLIRGTIRANLQTDLAILAIRDSHFTDDKGYVKRFFNNGVTLNTRLNEWNGEWLECPATYTDQGLDWASHTYTTATITANSINIATVSVSGTDTATSDPYTCILGEIIRIVVTVTNSGGDLPNYDFDGNTGELEDGVNHLEFTATAGSKTFQINHTDGETATCVVSFLFYSLTGI